MVNFVGTGGDDTLKGSNNADNFDMSQGGDDTVIGRAGDDVVSFGTAFTAADSINGGAGNDTVTITGGLVVTLGAHTLISVETLALGGANFGDNLTMNDANVAAGQTLTVIDNAVGHTLRFNGTAESDGNFDIQSTGRGRAFISGGAGDDTITVNSKYSTLSGGAGNDSLDASSGQHSSLSGGGGNDVLVGADTRLHGKPPTGTFNLNGGGNDTVIGGSGDDTITINGGLNSHDSIEGGGGINSLSLNGDYTGEHALDLSMVSDINFLTLNAGHSYDLTTSSAVPVITATLNSGDALTLDASADASGLNLVSTAGLNIITGSSDSDTISLNTIEGADRIDGGAGTDLLTIHGSGHSVFQNPTLSGIEKIVFTTGTYNITTADANIAGYDTLTVDASALGVNDALVFHGAAETHGNFDFLAGAGDDALYAGGGNDLFHLEQGGTDIASGGAGNDQFFLGADLATLDRIHGGDGDDTVFLNGNYFTHLAFDHGTLTGIETVSLATGNDYNLSTDDNTVANGTTMTVDASALASDERLTWNGSAETHGHFVFDSGNGSDNLTGGAARDTFVYNDGITLSGTERDIVHAFDFSNDIVQFANITGIDSAVTTGSVSHGSIDADLTGIFGAAQAHELGAHHAVLFTASGGDFAGTTFLIVDGDGVAGYTSGSDLVIQLDGALHAGDIGTANFTG